MHDAGGNLQGWLRPDGWSPQRGSQMNDIAESLRVEQPYVSRHLMF